HPLTPLINSIAALLSASLWSRATAVLSRLKSYFPVGSRSWMVDGTMISSARSSALRIGRRVHVAAKRWRTSTAAGARPSPLFEYKVQSTEDPKPRKTCTTCGFVNYENPKVICGSVLTTKGGADGIDDFYVLGRRSIQPRRGFWGIPAGFLELGETGEEGAAREAREEMNADVDVGGLLAVYSLPHIGQIQMIYSSELRDTQGANDALANNAHSFSAGQETDEANCVPFEYVQVISVRWEDIPWDTLAFPTTSWALWHHRLRVEEAAKMSTISSSSGAPLDTGEGRRRGFSGGDTVSAVAKAVVDDDFVVGTRTDHSKPGVSDTMGTGVGVAFGAIAGTVFSVPSVNSSLFWRPAEGLHQKEGWNVSTDS
ncbi:unnamed protein product, partial [Ectocarpus sp. 12 AP-2014]